jgi:hypothetical protein
MGPRPDGVDVVWSVTAGAKGWVEWVSGEGDPDDRPASDRHIANLDAFGFVPQGHRVIRVRIAGWAPGGTYFVRAVTESADGARRSESGWKRVRTLDPAASSTSFVVWNDTHRNEETLRRLDEASPQADFWVWNGDVCNNWNDPDEIAPTILNPAGRDVTTGRTMAFSWGNHDVRGPWGYRVSEVVATPESKPYYAFRSGPVAAMVLSTGEDKPDGHPSFGGRVAFQQLRRHQAEWLAEQVRKPGFADAPYRIVFCHMPLRWIDEPILNEDDYATGNFDRYSRVSRELWDASLREWGAQVVVSGHTHRPEWMPATAEFPYAQLTGGGPQSWKATWIEGRADRDGLTLTTRRLDGSVLHQATIAPR